MKVTVQFVDGERIEGSSEAMTLTQMGFPLVPDASNNELIWASLSSIKYVIVHAGNREPSEQGDPRTDRGLPKVVIRFHDGEVIRTYRDDSWGQEAEGFSLRVWDSRLRSLVRVLVSLHAVKGIFFVKEWDSRTAAEKIEHTGRRSSNGHDGRNGNGATHGPAHRPAGGEGDVRIEELARTYRSRLAQIRDRKLSLGSPAEFAGAVREHLVRLLERDSVALSPEDLQHLQDAILRNAFGYGPLDPLLVDPNVTEIMVNGTDNIYVEREGRLHRTAYRFASDHQVLDVIRKMAASIGRRIDESTPMVDARLGDGSRMNAVMSPASVDGPVLTIRKFAAVLGSLSDLVAQGTLSEDMARFLQAAVIGRVNLVISGGTGSGKTTTLNVLGSLVPESERVVTIEETAELQFAHPHVVRLEYRPPNVEGRGELTIRQLLRNSLRMRPDRIIIGETRGAEALDMLQAMNTGHDGSMSTIHANSARDAVTRLESMMLSSSLDMPLEAVRTQILSGVDLLVHQVRGSDGRRRVTEISELVGFGDGGPIRRQLYATPEGGVQAVATGIEPACLDKMAANGARPS